LKAGNNQIEELSAWDKAALSSMKNRPNPDGSLGVMITDGPSAVAWHDYFASNDMMAKANNLAYRVKTGGTYMVPRPYPWQYDTAWPRREYPVAALGRSAANVEGTKREVIEGFERLARSLPKGGGKFTDGDAFQRYCRSRKPGQQIVVSGDEYRDFCNAILGE
jgi:hypothetical protein